MHYFHVDVFSGLPYSGNSLAVFPDAAGLTGVQMARITQELRHFESIFLTRDGDSWQARVFDLVEELDFAGHPVIGAACVLHARHGADDNASWTMRLKARTVEVTTRRRGSRAIRERPRPGAGFPSRPNGHTRGGLLVLVGHR